MTPPAAFVAASPPAPAVLALHEHRAAAPRTFRRLPGPFSALIVHAGDPGRWRPADGAWSLAPRVALYGLATGWSEIATAGDDHYVVAFLAPWAMAELCGRAAPACVDAMVDLTAHPRFRALPAAVAAGHGLAAVAAVLSRLSPDPVTLAPALDAIHRSAGAVPVAVAARLAGCDERRFRAACHAELGVGPKRWAMLERFAANLRRLHPAPFDGPGPAPDYFDRAHEIREFRRLAGITPGAYAREKQGGDRRVFATG